MIRVLALLALAGLGATAAACGDKGDDDLEVAKSDASTRAPSADGAVRGAQIDAKSLGAACERVSECRGGGELACLTRFPDGSRLPGGYCTAKCNASSDCGPGGGCPTGDFVAAPSLKDYAAEITGMLPQVCYQACVRTSDCAREGYVCRSLIATRLQSAASAILGLVPSLGYDYCVPPVADAGTPDASTSALSVGAGLDSGL
jgi:hypothetical protein